MGDQKKLILSKLVKGQKQQQGPPGSAGYAVPVGSSFNDQLMN